MDLLYVLGAGHSGSSLFDVLLGSHPQILSCGEVHRLSIAPHTRVCSCSEILNNCPVWSVAQTEFKDRHGRRALLHTLKRNKLAQVGTSALLLSPTTKIARIAGPVRRDLAAAAESWELLTIAARRTGSFLTVDSSKTPNRLLALHRTKPLHSNLHVARVIRDGRAVAASQMRRTGCTMTKAVTDWVIANLKADISIKRLPEIRPRTIKYEALCANVEHTLDPLLTELALGTSPISVPRQNEYHAIPGNPALLRGFGDVKLDDRWRRELSANDLKQFDRIGGWLNRRMGYSS